jgi:hypothetical protein
VLENLRFHQGEKSRDAGFAAELAGLAEVYCHESFGTGAPQRCLDDRRAGADRAARQALRSGIPAAAGAQCLAEAFDAPNRPFIAILGGAKISERLSSIDNLLGRVDTLLIGGPMAYTMLRGLDIHVGDSRIEPELGKRAAQAARRAAQSGTRLLTPVDYVCAQQETEKAATRVFQHAIPDGWLGLDIGPKTLQQYLSEVTKARTIYWNGAMGAAAERCVCRRNPQVGTSRRDGRQAEPCDQRPGRRGKRRRGGRVRRDRSDDSRFDGDEASLHVLEGHRFSSVDLLDDPARVRASNACSVTATRVSRWRRA